MSSGTPSAAASALARGDLAACYDLAGSELAAAPTSAALRHLQVLALARMGDTDGAQRLFDRFGLAGSTDPHHRAAGARLLKDRALKLPPGAERQAALDAAWAAYLAIYRESGDPFPGVNAASVAVLAGRREEAAAVAAELLAMPAVAAGEDYYMAVTAAETLLVCGRSEDALAALDRPIVRGSDDHGARASSRRQLELVAEALGLPERTRAALAEPLAAPAVAHFAGHMFAADASREAALAEAIAAAIREEKIGFGYGALACGADILSAEALIASGAELHVVLPFDEPDFLDQSVRPGGEAWLPRYRRCREAAASVAFASAGPFLGDSNQYCYASRFAMGLARLRAEHLGGDALQLAVWDGEGAASEAGTGADVRAWQGAGGRTRTIGPGPIRRDLVRPQPAHPVPKERVLAAILFTDFKGFSSLPEHALPRFWDGVMRAVADVLERHGDAVASRNSWGDALFAVTRSAAAAAEIALEIQAALARFDYEGAGLPADGGMRVGAHYGPAYRGVDHITGAWTYYGGEVSRAARIEPITPPGSVFVTQPFAAILALEARERFTCLYVGRIPLAKNVGEYPMYRLVRRSG